MKKTTRGDQFPMPVTRGSVTVLINRIRKQNGYVYFQLRFYVDGVRKAKSCSDLDEAKRAAATIATKLHQGETHDLQVAARADRIIHLQDG
jgi:hypothetical protein